MEGSASERRNSIVLGEIDNKSDVIIVSNSNDDIKSSETNIIEVDESTDEERQIMNESKEDRTITPRNSESISPQHDKKKSVELIISDIREASRSLKEGHPEQQQLQKTMGSRRASISLNNIPEEHPVVGEASVNLKNLPDEPHPLDEVASPSGIHVLSPSGASVIFEHEPHDEEMSCGGDSSLDENSDHETSYGKPIRPEKVTSGGDEDQEDRKAVNEMGNMQEMTPGEVPEDSSSIDVSEKVTPGGDEYVNEDVIEMGIMMTLGGGAEDSNGIDPFTESEDISSIEDITPGQVKQDCAFCFKHRWSCFWCWHFLFALFCVCFYLAPHPLEVCLSFSFNNEDIAYKVFGDNGSFQLEIMNPNILPIDIEHLEITAYSGGVEEQNHVMNLEYSSVLALDGRSSKLENGTYVFTQNSTAFVTEANAYCCSEGLRTDLEFDLEFSFNGCMLSFLCLSNVVSELNFLSECPGHNNWLCTELDIFG